MNYFAIGLLAFFIYVLASAMVGGWIERICKCVETCTRIKYQGGHRYDDDGK